MRETPRGQLPVAFQEGGFPLHVVHGLGHRLGKDREGNDIKLLEREESPPSPWNLCKRDRSDPSSSSHQAAEPGKGGTGSGHRRFSTVLNLGWMFLVGFFGVGLGTMCRLAVL